MVVNAVPMVLPKIPLVHDFYVEAHERSIPEPLPWDVITASFPLRNASCKFWWKTTGSALALLLHHANYLPEAQYRNLLFYFFHIIPELGPRPNATRLPTDWRSFMTDDHTPIEISWNWGSGSDPVTVRFSIEPIGHYAGTSVDPLNEYATDRLIRRFQHILPDTDLEWYRHFSNSILTFNRTAAEILTSPPAPGHRSRTFVAFDLEDHDLLLKAYFLPAQKALETGQSSLEIFSEAIAALPVEQSKPLFGVHTLLDYINTSPAAWKLEPEILGIDCVVPSSSRIKIYLRSRCTTFESVKEIMTLGGRLSGLHSALGDLQELWRLVLGTLDDFTVTDPLRRNDHRTAGVLYYFEIRAGKDPVPKVYIPVRHYGETDAAILCGLEIYLSRRRKGVMIGRYRQAMEALFTTPVLQFYTGAQTYLGCTIKGGKLHVISYINPQVFKWAGLRP